MMSFRVRATTYVFAELLLLALEVQGLVLGAVLLDYIAN